MRAVIEEVVDSINKYGFPIIAACGMGYFIFFTWKWATEEIDPVLGSARTTLIGLVDRIRMLDNDMIRLNTKLTIALELHPELRDRFDEAKINQYITQSKVFDQSKVSYSNKPVDVEKKPTS